MSGVIGRSAAFAALALGLALVAGPAAPACVLSKIAELPVTMTTVRRPMVPAKINGADALFIADSGAVFSLISPSGAAQFGLKLGALPFNLTLRSIGGAVTPSMTTVKTFTLAGAPLSNVQFLVGGGDAGEGAAGFIGQNVLGLADVEYDLANGVIRLVRPHACGRRELAYWSVAEPFSVMALEAAPARTVGIVYVNGVPIHAVFDTGASLSVLSLRAAARAGVKRGDPGATPGGVFLGLGRRPMNTWIAPVASFKIGDEEIRNTRLRIGDLDLVDDIDMLLGADFFLSHRVYVANSQRKLYFTYNGGPVFNLGGTTRVQAGPGEAAKAAMPPDKSGGEPADAEAFSRRGAAFASRRQFDLAIADFTRACELAPNEARYFRQRATARLAAGQPILAMGDLDHALALAPDDVAARVARAELRLAGKDKAEASADLDVAAHAAPKEADVRLRLAGLYGATDQIDRAIAQYSLWIAAHRVDSRLAEALNGRCRARALDGRDLDQALADCNAALKLAPKTVPFLDSRGLVRLRLGDFDKSIADYDAALALRPRSAPSLYGRGLAKLGKAAKAEGEADLAAAVALAPHVGDELKKHGVGPP
ncbi:MAG: aspartyl protease family protein [Caulobacteraceae bacterium]